MLLYLISFIFAGVAIFFAYHLVVAKRNLKRFQGIVDVEKYIREKTGEGAQITKEIIASKEELDRLLKQVGQLAEQDELTSAGFYKSKFDFGSSDIYEKRIDEIRAKQKEMIKAGRAIICGTEWSIDGSKAKGKKMIDRIIKLGLSAFNVQCDNEILKVKFENIDRAEDRIQKIKDNVDKLLEPNRCEITSGFYKLKLEELYLCYEYVEKIQKEKDEQRALKEQMRDEERARREAEKAQLDAEKEEKRYSDALEKARSELILKNEKDQSKLVLKIQELEERLKAAVENKERAKSMAEMTRRGHVYIISNIGSFGDGVFKIGMTRRLDPNDRVDELSDASVPFDFDIHAMIASDDAPGLERKLHEKFSAFRLNKINERKEFFRVDIEHIKGACADLHAGNMHFTLVAEAKEFRQTVAINREKGVA